MGLGQVLLLGRLDPGPLHDAGVEDRDGRVEDLDRSVRGVRGAPRTACAAGGRIVPASRGDGPYVAHRVVRERATDHALAVLVGLVVKSVYGTGPEQ